MGSIGGGGWCLGGAHETRGEVRTRERGSWSSGERTVLKAGSFIMPSAELDYTIEIPDQPCRSRGMEGGLGPVVGRCDLTSLWVGSAAVAPPPCGSALSRSAPSQGPGGLRVALDQRAPPPCKPRPGVLNLPEPLPFVLCSVGGLFFLSFQPAFSSPCPRISPSS